MVSSVWAHHTSSDRRLFRIPIPHLPSLSAKAREVGIETSGGIFSLGLWVFIDSAIYSKFASGGDVHVTFTDWCPLICSVLGLIVYVFLF